jgi:hypothetical protein
MKNNIKLITIFTILFVVCLAGFYAFQNKTLRHGLPEIYKKESADSGIPSTKKVFKKKENNSINSVTTSSLLKNKLSSLQQKENNAKAEKIIARQDPFTGNNDYIPVIPIDSQTDIPESIKKKFIKRSEKMAEQGYINADDYTVLKLSTEAITIQHLGSEQRLEEVYDNLAFKPTSVKGSDFEQGEYLGHKTELGLLEDDQFHPFSEINDIEFSEFEYSEKEQKKMGEFSRYYKFPELGFVKLTERFLPEDSRSRIRVTPELMNADVNGNYALYMVQKSSVEQSLSMLTWINDDRQYILEASNTGNHTGETFKQRFFDLANTIP